MVRTEVSPIAGQAAQPMQRVVVGRAGTALEVDLTTACRADRPLVLFQLPARDDECVRVF